ncbi:MAG: hypothetical protein J6R42_02850, partial [Clostridia bacterium]|nr:hypothetical protein [Clostridia bacterium]
MATTNHVVDFLMENKSATLPEIQIRLHISYKEARSLLKQLEEDGKVTLVNDITFKLTAFIDEEEEEEEEE